MDSLVPAPLHRWLLRAAQPWRLRLWGLLRRQVDGVRVLGFADDGRVVLVRHSYHRPEQWHAPGGGIARGEPAIAAASRELAEETGCALHDAAHLGTVARTMRQGWTNRVTVIAGRISGSPRADGREIVEAALFWPDALPDQTSTAVHDFIALWAASKR